MNSVHSFPKKERLCSRKAIETLFASGNRSLTAFPLRVVYTPAEETQVLISVSKRHFKHAVDRNRAKRQIREAWRQNRSILISPLLPDVIDAPTPSLHLAFIWLADEPQPSELVHRKLKNLLHRIRELILHGVNRH